MLLKKLAQLLVDGIGEPDDAGTEPKIPEPKKKDEEHEMGNKKGKLHETMLEIAGKLSGADDDDEDEEVEMPKEDFDDEHKSLVKKLRKQDPVELNDEADAQEAEVDDEDKKKKKGGDAIKMALKSMLSKGAE